MDKTVRYYPLLDSLRAFACISVIVFHSNSAAFLRDKLDVSLFMGGYIGVDFFFTLSGFLITGILLEQFVRDGKINVLTFYKKRLLRLYPPILVAVIVFLVPLLFWNHIMALSNMFFLVTYTGDCVMLFRKLFPVLQYPSMFSHCWSLAVEEQFYLIFPVLFLFVMNRAKKSKKDNVVGTFISFNILFVILIIVLPILLKSYFYKFFLWRFLQVFMGSYLAFIYTKKYQDNYLHTRIARTTANLIYRFYENRIIAAMALVLFFIIFIFNITLTPFNIPIHYYLLTVICSIVVVNAYKANHILYQKLLNYDMIKYLGKISYGLYLFHWPVFYLKRLNIFSIPETLAGNITLDIISVLATLMLSVLSYELIEKIFLNYKKALV